MDSENQDQNLELLNVAIKKLIEERKNIPTSANADADDQLLLSRLLAQLESLREEQQQVKKQSETSRPRKSESCGDENVDREDEKIVREIKKVERQNVVTHWLLSAMIVLTVAWQISEVSLILKLKQGLSDGLRNPFKHLGGMLARMMKRPLPAAEDDGAAAAAADDKPNNNSSSSLLKDVVPVPPLKIPRVELPDLTDSQR